jgi:hypothetical protein
MKIAKVGLFVLTWFAYGLGVLPASDAVQTSQHYDYPASDKADLVSCITEQGGVPGSGQRAGVWDNVSQSEVNACQYATVWRQGKWNWNVRIEK